MVAGVGENVSEHRLGQAMVGVGLTQAGLETFNRVGDRPPGLGVGQRVPLEVVAAAGAREGRLVGEVAVHGDSTDPRALGDLADRRPGGADRLVQLDRRLDDPLPSLVLAHGATLQLVGARHANDVTPRISELDSRARRVYLLAQ